MRLRGIWCTRSVSLMLIIWFYRSFGTLDLSRLAIRSKWPISAEPLLCSDSTVYERFNGANALNIIYFNASDCVLIVTWFVRSTVSLWTNCTLVPQCVCILVTIGGGMWSRSIVSWIWPLFCVHPSVLSMCLFEFLSRDAPNHFDGVPLLLKILDIHSFLYYV